MYKTISTLEEMPMAVNYLIHKVDWLEEKLQELSMGEESVPKIPEWFDINGLHDYLPTHPAKQTIYGWVNDNLIPYYKSAGKLTFQKSEIDEWLKQGRRKSSEELEREAAQFVAQKKYSK